MNGFMLMSGASRPWTPCPRTYSGNMCGVFVDGLPPVPGGAADPRLVLSWFLDRYSPENQSRIKHNWASKGLYDVLLSWPDSRSQGASAKQFGDFCWQQYQNGFQPAVMLVSKNYDGPTLDGIKANVAPVLPFLKQRVGRICVGWELNAVQPFGANPKTLQQFIDWLAPQVVPWGARLYVHFTAGVASWQPNGSDFATFWNANIGQLTGLLWQSDVSWTPGFIQAKAKDILDRFAGQDFCSPDSGFGHPFDCIGLELQAAAAFAGNADETKQNAYAHAVVRTPASFGPFGPVTVLGSGNGVAA